MSSTSQPTVAQLAERLLSGATTSRQLVETCLNSIQDPAGEGSRAFIAVDPAAVRQSADAIDAMRKAGYSPSPFAGIPIAIKDLADIRGQTTAAGSKALADAPSATADAPVIARLRAAGFLLIGRTNMTEFAYSGLGINPHYGTPLSPWDRAQKRVPGGSSSGSAVAVADQMAYGALGTDTGGSCRIPAAFNGVVGYKPTSRRVPTGGVVPLSTSLDSIGPIASTVECCRLIDCVMAGDEPTEKTHFALAGARFLVPETIALDSLDSQVAQAFDTLLASLSKAGARVTRAKFAPFELVADVNRNGGLSGAESWHWHRSLIETKRTDYDPRVLARILRGKEQSAADYIELLAARRRAITAFDIAMQGYDAILSPTVPVVAPRIADCAKDEDYNRINMLVLRNTMMLNVLDGCSIAVPMHKPASAPTSVMISATAMSDARVFAMAAAVEAVVKR